MPWIYCVETFPDVILNVMIFISSFSLSYANFYYTTYVTNLSKTSQCAAISQSEAIAAPIDVQINFGMTCDENIYVCVL